MKLHKINLNNYSSIECNVSVNDNGTIMVANIFGNYGRGSEGNPDGLYIYSVVAAHYLVLEPISIILDIRHLNYSWGNTLLKALNFFFEIGRDDDERNKIVIIVTSEENRKAIIELLEMVNAGNRVLCDDYEKAFEIANSHVENFFR
jgi:hypothetical protein